LLGTLEEGLYFFPEHLPFFALGVGEIFASVGVADRREVGADLPVPDVLHNGSAIEAAAGFNSLCVQPQVGTEIGAGLGAKLVSCDLVGAGLVLPLADTGEDGAASGLMADALAEIVAEPGVHFQSLGR